MLPSLSLSSDLTNRQASILSTALHNLSFEHSTGEFPFHPLKITKSDSTAATDGILGLDLDDIHADPLLNVVSLFFQALSIAGRDRWKIYVVREYRFAP